MDSFASLRMTKVLYGGTKTATTTNKQQKGKKQMKKLIIIIALMIPMLAQSATMCSKDDTVTIVLDPAIGGTSNGYNQAQSTWWTGFPYGTIRGVSACLSSAYGKKIGGYVADLHDNNELVVGGERNGGYCWCKMKHPADSLWVFRYSHGSANACSVYCANGCADSTRNNSAIRLGLFGTVQ